MFDEDNELLLLPCVLNLDGVSNLSNPVEKRKSCCNGRHRRLASGRTTVGQVYSNPSDEETRGGSERSKVPSSSPMDAVMFNLAEMLGIVVGDVNASSTREDGRAIVTSVEDAKERITDGFSSFRGTGRFRRNVSNFGKVLTEPTCSLVALDVSEHDDTKALLVASWIFKAKVKWIGGLLAASGDTTYVLQRSLDGIEYRVVQHDERWKTSKSAVLRNMLFNRIKE
eukprot:jgi/Picre1/32436/NNA_007782.t1